MRKIKVFLLACVMIVSAITFNVSSASPDEIMPLWDNTYSVVIYHTAVDTTAQCGVDIAIESGSTIMNVVIKLIAMEESPQRVVKTWTDPEFTVDTAGTHRFFDTYSPVVPGKGYRLHLLCEVWHNGVCDEISLYKDVQY